MNSKLLAFVVLVMLAGLFYRVYDLGHDSYWIDESYTVLAAKNIGQFGIPQFDSGLRYSRAWPQSYALFAIGSVFGFGPIPMRILSVLAGTAFIGVMFLLARRFCSDRVALMTAAFTAVSYWQIAWSRQARMYIFLELFFFLSLYAYLRFLERPTVKRMLFTLASILFTYAFHRAALALPLIMACHFLLVRRRQVLFDAGRSLQFLSRNRKATIAVAVLVTLVAYFTLRQVLSAHVVMNYAPLYQNYIIKTQLVFIFLAVMGLFSSRERFSSNLLFALSLLAVLVGASFFVKSLNFRYVFIILPIISLFAAQGIEYGLSLVKSRIYAIASGVFLLLLLMQSGFFFAPTGHYALEKGTPQPPFAQSYDFIKEEGLSTAPIIVTQPAVAELYLKKPEYWLAFSYENLDPARYYNSSTMQEVYTAAVALPDVAALNRTLKKGTVVIIDDMGLERLPAGTRAMVQNLTLLHTAGTEFWSRSYVYTK